MTLQFLGNVSATLIRPTTHKDVPPVVPLHLLFAISPLPATFLHLLVSEVTGSVAHATVITRIVMAEWTLKTGYPMIRTHFVAMPKNGGMPHPLLNASCLRSMVFDGQSFGGCHIGTQLGSSSSMPYTASWRAWSPTIHETSSVSQMQVYHRHQKHLLPSVMTSKRSPEMPPPLFP